MQIADRRVATVHFTLTDDNGQTYASTRGHAPLVHMQGTGGIIPALEQALEGKEAGDRFEVQVTPETGFGPHFAALVQSVPRSLFNGQQAPVVGDRLQAKTNNGGGLVTVTAVDGDSIGVDGNHPLAGRNFTLEVEVMEVRVPTPDEIQFGVQSPAPTIIR